MKSPAFEWKILRLTYRQQIEIVFNQKSKKQLKNRDWKNVNYILQFEDFQ